MHIADWEIKSSLIFFDMQKVIVLLKHPVSFRTQNLFVSPKTTLIETKLRKLLILDFVTLWCNSATKVCICLIRSTTGSTSLHLWPRPLVRYWEEWFCISLRVVMIEIDLIENICILHLYFFIFFIQLLFIINSCNHFFVISHKFSVINFFKS